MSCEQQSPVAASTTQRVASVKKRGEEGGGEKCSTAVHA